MSTVTAYDTTFRLNKFYKYTAWDLLSRLETGCPIFINGVDDIYPSDNKITTLRQVIEYAKYLDDKAQREE